MVKKSQYIRMKIPYLSNLKKPACASKRDMLELATLRYIFFKVCFQFQAFKNLYPLISLRSRQTWENMKNFEKMFQFRKKKFLLQYRYRNWTLVSVPDSETWFRLHTRAKFIFLCCHSMVGYYGNILSPPCHIFYAYL